MALKVTHDLPIFNIKFTVRSLVTGYLQQNTLATASTAKRQTAFAVLDCKQHGEHRTARYPVIVCLFQCFLFLYYAVYNYYCIDV